MNLFRSRFKKRTKASSVPHDHVVSIIRTSTNSAGLWVGATGRGTSWFAHIAALSYQGTLLMQLIGMIMARNDAERLFECFSVFTFSCMGVLKLRSLRKDYARWLYILSQAEYLQRYQLEGNEPDLEYETDDESNGVRFGRHITRYTAKCRSVSEVLKKVYYITLTIFISSPFVEYVYRVVMKVESTYPHILPVWTPWEKLGFYGYLITITMEAVSAIYCVVVHTAFDLTAVGMMIFLTGQFTLLRDYSERIAGRGDRYDYTSERDIRAHHRIIKCHYFHLILINILNELGQLVMNILGIYYLVATLTLCSVAVRLNSEEISIMELVSLLQYMGGCLTQLFLLCHFGDALLHESSVGMGQGPFGAAYWCVRPRVRRELVLLGVGMMGPRLLRAGPFNTLDLPSFVQIVRAAYGYYAVLRK